MNIPPDNSFIDTYLLIGSNLGNREHYLNEAIRLLEKFGQVVNKSGIYETAAWGMDGNTPAFYNQALHFRCSLSAHDLMKRILIVETSLGRIRTDGEIMSRTIDIDILLYKDSVINDSFLVIPHPKMCERRFVLLPLTEIASTVLHPTLLLTIKYLLSSCKDKLQVSPINQRADH